MYKILLRLCNILLLASARVVRENNAGFFLDNANNNDMNYLINAAVSVLYLFVLTYLYATGRMDDVAEGEKD